MQFAINLAMLGAVLSQLASPLIVEADTSTKMANLSQNLISQGQTMTQGETPVKPSKAS